MKTVTASYFEPLRSTVFSLNKCLYYFTAWTTFDYTERYQISLIDSRIQVYPENRRKEEKIRVSTHQTTCSWPPRFPRGDRFPTYSWTAGRHSWFRPPSSLHYAIFAKRHWNSPINSVKNQKNRAIFRHVTRHELRRSAHTPSNLSNAARARWLAAGFHNNSAPNLKLLTRSKHQLWLIHDENHKPKSIITIKVTRNIVCYILKYNIASKYECNVN